MSGRRRFFAAAPAQQVPGRTVELEMQLRPAEALSPAAVAQPPAEGFYATWLPYDLMLAWFFDPSQGQAEALDGGGFSLRHPGAFAILDTRWVGTPAPGGPMPIPGARWHCVSMTVYAADYIGYPGLVWAGAGSTVTWALEWSAPALAPSGSYGPGWIESAFGDGATALGAGVDVETNAWAATPGWVTFTASPSVDGIPIAGLEMLIQHPEPG